MRNILARIGERDHADPRPQAVADWTLGAIDLQIEDVARTGNIAALIQAVLQAAVSDRYTPGFVTWLSANIIAKEGLGVQLGPQSFASPAQCKREHLHLTRALVLERFRETREELFKYLMELNDEISASRKRCYVHAFLSGSYDRAQQMQADRERIRLSDLDSERKRVEFELSFYDDDPKQDHARVSEILAGGPAAASPSSIKNSDRWVYDIDSLSSAFVVNSYI